MQAANAQSPKNRDPFAPPVVGTLVACIETTMHLIVGSEWRWPRGHALQGVYQTGSLARISTFLLHPHWLTVHSLLSTTNWAVCWILIPHVERSFSHPNRCAANKPIPMQVLMTATLEAQILHRTEWSIANYQSLFLVLNLPHLLLASTPVHRSVQQPWHDCSLVGCSHTIVCRPTTVSTLVPIPGTLLSLALKGPPHQITPDNHGKWRLEPSPQPSCASQS